MSDEKLDFDKGIRQKLFLPALAFAVFAAAVIDVMIPLLLTDIAKTFQVQVGTASTIASISSIAGVAVGLLMAVLSIRVDHKSLLLMGVSCISLAALGSYLAPSFLYLQLLYSLNGVGSVVVGAMALTMVGDFYTLDKRAKAVGWTVAAGFLAFTMGAPMTGLLVNFGDWRSVILWFNLPVSVLSLIFAMLVLPKPRQIQKTVKIDALTEYRQTLSNRSATACLFGTLFASSAAIVTTFVISFWKTNFAMTTSIGSIITMVNATSATSGGIIADQLINRTGRKNMGIATGFVLGILLILTFLMPTLELSWAVSFVRVLCASMMASAFASLLLEQVPEFRGAMMSLRGTFAGLSGFIGIAVSGILLNASDNYKVVGVFLAATSFASIAVVFLFAKDPPPRQANYLSNKDNSR